MTKRLAWILAGLAGPILLTAQEKVLKPGEVPPVVSAAAAKRFPKARVGRWSKETENGRTTYEASVTDSSGKRDAVFGEDGSLVAIEQVIAIPEVPAIAMKAVMTKFPGAVVRRAEKITRGNEVEFELGLAKAARKEVLVTPGGKILKEE